MMQLAYLADSLPGLPQHRPRRGHREQSQQRESQAWDVCHSRECGRDDGSTRSHRRVKQLGDLECDNICGKVVNSGCGRLGSPQGLNPRKTTTEGSLPVGRSRIFSEVSGAVNII
jgi:hypothetical protein